MQQPEFDFISFSRLAAQYWKRGKLATWCIYEGNTPHENRIGTLEWMNVSYRFTPGKQVWITEDQLAAIVIFLGWARVQPPYVPEAVPYTGKVWAAWTQSPARLEPPTGAGDWGAVFLTRERLTNFIENETMFKMQQWYVAELDLVACPLIFDLGTSDMATAFVTWPSKEGFKPF